jgi:glycosyltransferase involved in cell wall biosynthesis
MNSLGKLRIVFIAGTLGMGGAERQLFYILQALRTTGCEVFLLCLTTGEFWQEPIEKLGVSVIWVGRHPSPVLRLIKIYRIVAGFSPDLVQSQHFYTNLYAALIGRLSAIHELGAIRNDVLSEIKSNGLWGTLCLRLPRAMAANSKSAIETATNLKVKPERLYYLPNVIDCTVFEPSQHPPTQKLRILSIGRLGKQKNIGLLLEICSILKKSLKSDFQIKIVGDGPERFWLEQKANSLGLFPNQLNFTGDTDNVLPYYHSADIFVLTSLWEGMPNVIMEAMACGLPIVATSVGGIIDLIDDGITGYLVKPGDSECEQFVNILTVLAGDSGLRQRLGQNARKLVVEKYNSKFLSYYLENVYSQIIKKSHNTTR